MNRHYQLQGLNLILGPLTYPSKTAFPIYFPQVEREKTTTRGIRGTSMETAKGGYDGIWELLWARWIEEKRLPERPSEHISDLKYRRTVHQHRKSRDTFLNSIPRSVQVRIVSIFWISINIWLQKYGTKYHAVVSSLSIMTESLTNYLWCAWEHRAGCSENWLLARNVSSTCNPSGSALSGLTKDIKPLVDVNCHTEAIEFVYPL